MTRRSGKALIFYGKRLTGYEQVIEGAAASPHGAMERYGRLELDPVCRGPGDECGHD